MHFFSLHDNADLVEETCNLLDTCWPKSRFARRRKLGSPPTSRLPVSIAMVTILKLYCIRDMLRDFYYYVKADYGCLFQ